MSEIQNTQLENIHTIKESIPGLDQEKYDTLKDYPNFSTFESLLKTDFENKDKLIQLLNSISNIKLKLYFKSGFTLIDQKGINEFINDPKFASLIEKQTSQESKQTSQEKLKTFQDTYPIFKEGLTKYAQNNDKELLELLKKFENSYDNTDIDAFLTYFNSNPQKLQEIFSSLKDDEKSYTAFYSFLESTNDPNLLSRLQTIPKDPKDFTKQENRLDKLLDTSPYFPNASKEDIKKVGNILTTQIDEKRGYSKVIETGNLPPSSYIEGKNGYRIKTDIISPRLLDIRGAFSNEKLRIEGQKQVLENKLQSLNLNNIENTQNQIIKDIEILENKPHTFEGEMKLEGLRVELEKIEEIILKKEKIQNQINTLSQELTQREDEFLRYYTKEMGNSSETIQDKDKEAKDTLNFLDSIGVTHMLFSDFLRLQNLINKNQASLGLSKPLDINNGFTKSDAIDQTKNSDREFLNIWNKIVGKENNMTTESIRGGNIGDRFSSSSFGENLKQTGVLNNNGRLNFNFINEKLLKQ
ncbi:hypothetical protein H3C61_00895 [Candidatus Gracilibacteria bacterium]|nr:hypothetical protein [Candidatus Gracilibacteria bacterium]